MEEVHGVLKEAKGNIENIDLREGKISLKLTEEVKHVGAAAKEKEAMAEELRIGDTVTLNARPFDLENLNTGAVKTLRFYDYEGERWLAPQKGSVAAIQKRGWTTQTAQGQIEELDKKKGEVTIDGESYKAHPEQTKDLEPGQFVSLSFSEFNDNQWVAGVKPQKQSEQQKQQQQEMEQQQQEMEQQQKEMEQQQQQQPTQPGQQMP